MNLFKIMINRIRRYFFSVFLKIISLNKINTLEKKLLEEKKTRWLDLGCGGNFTPGFFYLDYFANVEIPDEVKNRYFKYNILELSAPEIKEMGTFDLIRMQHVFEHFTPEEGRIVLENCAKLLSKDGYLLITVPDLEKHIRFYKRSNYFNYYTFYHWALNRIEKDAPASFFFSIYTHSLLHEQHKWCYDAKGLKYIISLSQKYTNIKQLSICSQLSSIPFTHNRVEEDLCVIAQKKNN